MAFGIFGRGPSAGGGKKKSRRSSVKAMEAEAAGEYLEAARAYLAVSDYNKVGEMHLLASERATTPDGKLEALREAARWSDADDVEGARKVRRRVAAAMLAWSRVRGVITDGDRAVVTEAAALFDSAGDAAGAGACHELLGAPVAAAAAYQSAGEVDRLEKVLEDEADRRRRSVAVSDAIEDHRLRLRTGDPAGALASLYIAIESSEPRDRTGLERTRDELAARRLGNGRVQLSAVDASGTIGGDRLVIVSAPLTLGRDLSARVVLRDAGISRQHAEIVCDDGVWSLVDLGSKNGTSLHGVRVAGRLPLSGRGELGVGDRCGLRFELDGEQLTLEVIRGLDRGLRIQSGGREPVALFGMSVRFVDGRTRIRASGSTQPLRINGVSVPGEIEPLLGDIIEIGAQRWTVGA